MSRHNFRNDHVRRFDSRGESPRFARAFDLAPSTDAPDRDAFVGFRVATPTGPLVEPAESADTIRPRLNGDN